MWRILLCISFTIIVIPAEEQSEGRVPKLHVFRGAEKWPGIKISRHVNVVNVPHILASSEVTATNTTVPSTKSRPSTPKPETTKPIKKSPSTQRASSWIKSIPREYLFGSGIALALIFVVFTGASSVLLYMINSRRSPQQRAIPVNSRTTSVGVQPSFGAVLPSTPQRPVESPLATETGGPMDEIKQDSQMQHQLRTVLLPAGTSLMAFPVRPRSKHSKGRRSNKNERFYRLYLYKEGAPPLMENNDQTLNL
ncbi:unnamed protein product [Cyprideis torosa]|uniref:Uncharacterized protein n=1 Tax=Cyprideis torosa TaxID=163714 RepID=A0A7R8W2K7_9CRUS|nr:unnamed protein product [Cyprideis torosa]CAG0879871.1 unnamed protein product [Cyprideis torosa]